MNIQENDRIKVKDIDLRVYLKNEGKNIRNKCNCKCCFRNYRVVLKFHKKLLEEKIDIILFQIGVMIQF